MASPNRFVRRYALAAFALLSATSNTSAFTLTTTTRRNTASLSTSRLFSTTIEAPVRKPETTDRVQQVRERSKAASIDATNAKGCVIQDTGNEWWRSLPQQPYRAVTPEDPLRVIVAGGGIAGLVVAAGCHSKGMKVAIFEQAGQYAPYGGPIQIQSNALRALERINKKVYEEITKAGTVTADRVSGLKIGYKKGVFLGLGQMYEKGDWLVKFDTLQPALDAGMSATVVVDRPVIQQILLNHGIPEGTVRIKSRIFNYEELGEGKGIKVRTRQNATGNATARPPFMFTLFSEHVHNDSIAPLFCFMLFVLSSQVTLEDGTVAYADVLIGADGIWSSIRRIMHGLQAGADGFAASGAAGGALNEAEARRMAKDSILMAGGANRRYSQFTCYAALCEHRASNIEEVSYQILLGKDKYFVSTDGGGERQQW